MICHFKYLLTCVCHSQKKKMSEEELKKLSQQYDQMTEKFQKEKDEYVDACLNSLLKGVQFLMNIY